MGSAAARKLDPPEPDPEERTPESFLEEIEEILNSGTLKGAREVAEQGLALFPDHPDLKQAHHALRPFERARVVPGYRVSDQSDSFDWLRKNGSKHRGQWVGLAHGQLIAASESFEQVVQALRLQILDPRDTLLHFID
ncbi:MAG TPA: hypothetical protein VF173_16215 [Thermoanaerobaculia bacterium]|nr:hypothetical protein [Thermoanaerobaculia bacterium]